MPLTSLPPEILQIVLTFVDPQHYLALALTCRTLLANAQGHLWKRKQYYHVRIDKPCPRNVSPPASARNSLAVNGQPEAISFQGTLPFIEAVVADTTGALPQCTETLTADIYPLRIEGDQLAALVAVARLTQSTLTFFVKAGVLNSIDAVPLSSLLLSYDHQLLLLLLLLPELRYISLHADCDLPRTTVLLKKIAHSFFDMHEPPLTKLEHARMKGNTWTLSTVMLWASLPSMRTMEIEPLSRVNGQHISVLFESKLTHLRIVQATLSGQDLWQLFNGLKRLKKLSYHSSVDSLHWYRWSVDDFFVAARGCLSRTLEYLEVSLGTYDFDNHYWGCCGPLTEMTRLKDLMLDCNMLYSSAVQSGEANAPVGVALLETKDGDRLLPRLLPDNIETLTIRDQRIDAHSEDQYLAAHKALTDVLLGGSPALLRQTYPNLKVINNLPTIDDDLKKGLEGVGIRFESRKYPWEG